MTKFPKFSRRIEKSEISIIIENFYSFFMNFRISGLKNPQNLFQPLIDTAKWLKIPRKPRPNRLANLIYILYNIIYK